MKGLKRFDPPRFLRWLILLTVLVGVLAGFSYSLAIPQLLRAKDAAFGAWCDAHQFYWMEGAATALGLWLGIAIGGSSIAAIERRSLAALIALVLAIIVLDPLTHACAAAARLGWSGRDASVASWIFSHEGYVAGRQLDKVLITAIYFAKTAAFALLGGLALAALGSVASFAKQPRGEPPLANARAVESRRSGIAGE